MIASGAFFAASMRAAALLGESGRERAEVRGVLQALGRGTDAVAALDTVRRAVVETLVNGERVALVAVLDEALLGARPRPVASLDLQAVSL